MLRFEHKEEILILENDVITFEFEMKTRMMYLYAKSEGKYIISKACSSIEYDSSTFSTLNGMNLKWETKKFENEIGKGMSLTIQFSSEEHPQLALMVELHEDKPFVFLRNAITNNLKKEIKVKSLNPLILTDGHFSTLDLGTTVNDWKILAGAYQSWSPVKLVGPFDRNFVPKVPDSVYPGRLILLSNPNEKREKHEQVGDNYIIMKNLRTRSNILFGFLTFKDQFNQILFQFDKKKNSLKKIKARCQADNIILKPDEKLASEALMINFITPPLENLMLYAEMVGKMSRTIPWEEVPTGYCTWYIYFHKIDEVECLKNVHFIAGKQDKIPIKYYQLDDGYQLDIGDWEANKKFPGGMRNLVQKIEEAGFIAGLWIAPFMIGKKSKVFKAHPDWILRKNNGKPLSVLRNPAWGLFNNMYALDCSHPEVQEWLRSLFTKITQDWGFKCIKIDFVYAACANSNFHDTNKTRAQVYRKGIELIRETIGPEVLLLGCGAPIGPSIGIVNAMRVSTDTAPDFLPFLSKLAIKFVNVHNAPCVYNAMKNNIRSFFMHRKLWINDPDCLMVRLKKTKLSEDEVKIEITCIGLLNGYYFLSDDFDVVDEKQINLIKKFFPYEGQTAIPIDLFENEMPEILDLPIIRDHGEWHVVGIFNWSAKPRDVTLNFQDLGLNSGEKYHVFEFWNQKYHGIHVGRIKFKALEKHSCLLLSIKEVKNTPQLLSTTFHFTQGAVEIKSIEFDGDSRKLHLSLDFPGKNEGSLFFSNPEDTEWHVENPGKCELIRLSKEIYELRIKFENDFETFINC